MRCFVPVLAALALRIAAPPSERDEREVTWDEAHPAGATLPDPSVADAAAGCRATTGVARGGGVLFTLRCPGTLGTTSTHPAYAGLRLKNGWKVKDVRATAVAQTKAGFELEKPKPGADQPFLKGTLWAGPGGEVLVEVTVTVEGSKGTSWAR